MFQDDLPELDPYEDADSPELRRIERLAWALDAKFTIPGTRIRFGWDALIGLIPVAGDTLTLLPQCYLLFEAYRLKLGAETLLRMGLNILIDWLVGTIPLLGDIFDLAFKSNLRNAKLVGEAIRHRRARGADAEV